MFTGWVRVGADPWLGNVDYPNNYIYSGKWDSIGCFAFISPYIYGITGFEHIKKVELQIYTHRTGDDTSLKVWLWTWSQGWVHLGDIIPDLTYDWATIDITAYITSWVDIDTAFIYITYKQVGMET